MTREAIAPRRRLPRPVTRPVAAARGAPGWLGRYLGAAAAADVLSALVAGTVAYLIRYHARAHPAAEYLAFSGGLPVLWWASVWLSGGYDARIVGAGDDEFHRILRAGLSLTACIAVVSYAAKLDLARGYVVLALPCATVLDLLARYALRKQLHARRRRGGCTHRVVAVGSAPAITELAAILSRDRSHGLSVIAACLADDGQGAGQIAGIPVCGSVSGVTEAVARFRADTVAVIGSARLTGTQLRELAWALEKTGTGLFVAPALVDVGGPRTTIRPVAGLPLLHLDHATLSGPKLLFKGAFDRVAAAVALVVLAPALAVLAWAIRRDGGPALFRQIRLGKDALPFTLYKFRTMVVDAEARKAELESRNEVNGILFKIRKDPRLTPLGTWMRRWSVDEIPQLLNVLRGEMSFVGPRPWAALPYEKAATAGKQVPRRLAVKPGLTGLWQVSGRADLPWEESVRLDVRYIEHWSLALDLQILWKTTRAVLRGTGAY